MQKDLKIGLIMGLILIIFIGLRLVTDPRLSTKARMEKIREAESEGRSQDIFSDESYAGSSRTSTTASSTDSTELPGLSEDKTKEPAASSGELGRAEPLTAETRLEKDPEVIKTQKFYIVQRGDTLSGISQKYYGTAAKWPRILEANRDILKDPNKLQPGMKLIIPEQ
jgi:nucleoid-associated protein YgaU